MNSKCLSELYFNQRHQTKLKKHFPSSHGVSIDRLMAA
jgi:hypothetical protein